MIKNYLKIALRNFKANKFYTVINIFGLSIGLTCFVLIVLFVSDEMSYDTFHENHEQIYFIGVERKFGGDFKKSRITQYPLGRTAVDEVSGIENYVTITPPNPARVSLDNKDFLSGVGSIASSPGFFTLFGFPLKVGNPSVVLQDPGTVVITEKIAEQYFPNENPIGKTLFIDRYGIAEYTITGIAENGKKNSYLDFDLVFSIQGLSSTKKNLNSWGSSMYNTFAKLQNGVERTQIESVANEAFDTHLGEARASNTNYFFVPISELYLSDLITPTGFKGSYVYIYIFMSIALFILVLANINYMNLSTARGMQRGREVGVRKVLGANKRQLIKQFLGESVILSLFSLIVAFTIATLVLPGFNQFFDKSLSLNLDENYWLILALISITIGLGALSGLYPAVFLSGFKTSEVLKGRPSNTIGGVSLRKILVVFQFSISTVLIVGTIVVLTQLDYLLNKDLGFEKEHTLYISFDSISNKSAFIDKIESHQAVISTSHSNGIPGRFYFSTSQEFDNQRPDVQFAAHVIATDEKFHETLGLQLLAGRYFEEGRSDDQKDAIVINEAMQKRMNWLSADEAIGQKLSTGDEVIGVVKDFHFRTLRTEITPVIINSIHTPSSSFSGGEVLVVRFLPDQIQSFIPYIQSTWNEIVSGTPLEYGFLDEQMDKLYETDKKLGTVFSFFAGIGILISCMGLLGLTAFSAELRTKEIGIRKVLGATVTNIVSLLSTDFLRLVAIGFTIAIPFSWYIMNKWLSDFSYRIDIGIGIFLLAGGAALLVSGLTTSWQSIKAATMNPVKSLKNE